MISDTLSVSVGWSQQIVDHEQVHLSEYTSIQQSGSQNVGYLPTIYSEDVLHPYGVIFNFLSCREAWGVVTL